MRNIETDICVIGAGAGGLSVASGAVQMGARVVLVEAGEMGGDCLNYGCVPSKALLSAAARAQNMRKGGLGTAAHAPEIDFQAVMAHVKDVIAGIAPHDSQERFEGLGVEVIRDFGKFIDAKTLQAGDVTITARRFVIATGSSAFVPPIEGLSHVPYLTNETLFEVEELPQHLMILGAGPIGLEMAQAFRRLGSEVTVIEGFKALGRDDPDAAKVVLSALREEGVTILEENLAAKVTGQAGEITVETNTGAVIEGSHLLVAVGRRANIAGLDLEKAGIATEHGRIRVDDTLRSDNKKIYAIGDVSSAMQFTHVAGYQAGVAIRGLLFGVPAKAREDHIPRVTYTSPELAAVGLSEEEARVKFGDALQVFKVDLADNDRARAEGISTGFGKLFVVKGRPVGALIVGAGAGDMIDVWALAIASKLKLTAIAGMIAPYPTKGELNKRLASAYFTPKIFDSNMVKTIVRFVQKWIP